jgi:hypothetical protein
MCAGLGMVLRCNIPIHRYYHSDMDPIARTLAVTRLITLLLGYSPLNAFVENLANTGVI